MGPYRLEVKASGFKDYIESGIVLAVNNNIQINVTMQIGSISEKVEVTATTSLVETKETSVMSVIDEQRISDLPLNNRQATQLIMTLGAAVYADRKIGMEDFAAKILLLLGDADARKRMGEFGKKRVQGELAWEFSVTHLLAAYDRAFSKRAH